MNINKSIKLVGKVWATFTVDESEVSKSITRVHHIKTVHVLVVLVCSPWRNSWTGPYRLCVTKDFIFISKRIVLNRAISSGSSTLFARIMRRISSNPRVLRKDYPDPSPLLPLLFLLIHTYIPRFWTQNCISKGLSQRTRFNPSFVQLMARICWNPRVCRKPTLRIIPLLHLPSFIASSHPYCPLEQK